MLRELLSGAVLAVGAACLQAGTQASQPDLPSREARLGRLIFFDKSLSASGQLSCASCHDPSNAYAAPATAGLLMQGGASLDRVGLRTVPSLRYLSDTPRFTRHHYVDRGSEREDVGPAGGFMLDGRAAGLSAQALLPLLDPAEMANTSVADLAARLRRTPYAQELEAASGAPAGDPQLLIQHAAHALERFELEDASFHPYSSRFDRYLAGREKLSAMEIEGLRLFADPAKGNCAACHPIATGPGGRGPALTDHSFHALGVPRNPAISANRDPRFFDLGLCGPLRSDLMHETQYCGYFKTPTLRNVARRRFFFHNGRFTSLRQVLRFYVTRDLRPQEWYPRQASKPGEFDDLPARYRNNVNVSDAPLNRRRGDRPALDEHEIEAVIAFLGTLDDAD
jgi:cytochrome c peroxidase